MLGVHLTIDQRHPPMVEVLYEGHKRYFARVARMGKHGLAKERASQGHAVKPSDENTPIISFHTVGEARAVEMEVGLDHVIGDPGALLVGPRYL
jgi:hypothetical protein